MMHLIAFAAILVVLVQISHMKTVEDHWEDFKKTFERKYEAEEEVNRKNIFKDNFDKIQKHNEEAARGIHTYTLKVTPFADMTNEEFRKSRMSDFKLEGTFPEAGVHVQSRPKAPDYVNWAESTCTTPVLNQGSCGSCWAFCAAGAMECMHKIHTNELIQLSPQNILDCTTPDGSPNSCKLGSSMSVFQQFTNERKAVNTLNDYPYQGFKSQCRYDMKKKHVLCAGLARVGRSMQEIKNTLANVGPICITIDTSPPSFQHFGKGIYNDRRCSSTNYNHVCLLVGYGPGYFIIKNSWGPRWGDGGFIKISSDNNLCGVLNWGNYPRWR